MRTGTVYVIGHKNPDTDSICSAIALAELKRAAGMENVVAARAGDLNPQTSFILDYLKVEPPRYVPDVYPRARDVMTGEVVKVSEETTVGKVMELMRNEGVRFVPVLDAGGRPRGVLTIMDLARRYIVKMEAPGSREVTTTLKNIADSLGAVTLLDFSAGELSTFSLFVGAMEEGSFIKIIEERDPRGCAVIVGDRADIQRRSVEMGVGLLIISGGFALDAQALEEAKKNGVSVVVSPYDSAATAQLVRLSPPAHKLCTVPYEQAHPDEPVEELKFKLSKSDGMVVVDDEGVMQGVITKSSLLRPSGVRLVLVDHNELSQAVDGAGMVEILEVVDHHRIGNFQSSQAISFVCDPVGSTSTLVAERYRSLGAEIRKETAGLLLGGVLSDTVILKSPTTTERDRSIVGWLEERSGLDHAKFGAEIFGATSSIKKRGAGAVVGGDHKVFEAKGKMFGVGQVETVGFAEFYEEKAALAKELDRVRGAKGLSLSSLLVTDIVCGTSLFIAVGEKEVIYNLGYPKLEDGVYELKNVISRKKQVVPHLLSVFNEIY